MVAMTIVLQLSKILKSPPERVDLPGIQLRHFAGPEDIAPWLRLREAAFARQRVGVRQWTAEDFAAELLNKPWWSHERMWLAESTSLTGEPKLVGSVTWADRASQSEIRPAIHWLAVLPSWRQQGVGRLLMSALESSCWEAGYRQIWLETHAAWTAAGEFYKRLGYEPV